MEARPGGGQGTLHCAQFHSFTGCGCHAGGMEACVPCPQFLRLQGPSVTSSQGGEARGDGDARLSLPGIRKGTDSLCAPPAHGGWSRKVTEAVGAGEAAGPLQRREGPSVLAPQPTLLASLPHSLPGGSTPPTCHARTCIPRGSTTSARSPCPCTGTTTATAPSHHASRPVTSRLF